MAPRFVHKQTKLQEIVLRSRTMAVALAARLPRGSVWRRIWPPVSAVAAWSMTSANRRRKIDVQQSPPFAARRVGRGEALIARLRPGPRTSRPTEMTVAPPACAAVSPSIGSRPRSPPRARGSPFKRGTDRLARHPPGRSPFRAVVGRSALLPGAPDRPRRRSPHHLQGQIAGRHRSAVRRLPRARGRRRRDRPIDGGVVRQSVRFGPIRRAACGRRAHAAVLHRRRLADRGCKGPLLGRARISLCWSPTLGRYPAVVNALCGCSAAGWLSSSRIRVDARAGRPVPTHCFAPSIRQAGRAPSLLPPVGNDAAPRRPLSGLLSALSRLPPVTAAAGADRGRSALHLVRPRRADMAAAAPKGK